MIDLFAARQSCGLKDIDNTGLLRGEDNISDDLAKMYCNGNFLVAMQFGRPDQPVLDLILRFYFPSKCRAGCYWLC